MLEDVSEILVTLPSRVKGEEVSHGVIVVRGEQVSKLVLRSREKPLVRVDV